MSNVILLPVPYFPSPDQSQALGLGSVYIGNPNTDPTILANRISVTITEQDGTEVVIAAASQPLELGAGGVIMYDGSPIAQLNAGTNYSMAVLDSNDVQKFYFPNAGLPSLVADIQNSTYTYLTNVAGTNTVTAEADPALTAYAVGQMFHFTPANTNSGAVTLNIDGLGAGAVQLNGDALTGGELGQDKPAIVVCTAVTPTFEIVSWSFKTAVRTFLSQATQALMRTTGLGISAAMDAVITAASLALGRVALGFSADTYLGGVWTTQAFNAADYTANGAMTWTVAAGDVTTNAYIINGKMMTWNFVITTTTVGGTPDTTLIMTIPGSKVSTKTAYVQLKVDDNGTGETGFAFVGAGGTTLSIQRANGGNFSASVNATFIAGQITLEID